MLCLNNHDEYAFYSVGKNIYNYGFLNSHFNSFQNDMGLKPHDCAKVMGQKECAEFLLLYETSLEMAKELSEVHTKREVLMAEHNELRSYFKYVHMQ